jgi:Flp pilus assembly protein TadD
VNIEPIIEQVATLVAERRTEEALVVARAAVERAPETPQLHRAVAWVCLRGGDLVQAHAAARRAIELEPEGAAGWRLLGTALLALGQNSAAAEALSRSLELDPEDPLAADQLATAFRRERRFEQAEQVLVALLERQPQRAEAHAQLAVLRDELRDREGARAAAEAALACDPTQPQARHLLATFALAEGRRDEARERLEAMLQDPLPPNVRVSAGLELARLLDRDGEPEAAWTRLVEAQSLRRSTPEVRACDRRIWPRLLERVRLYGEARANHPAPPPIYPAPPIFVVGFPRSGTTLLEQILDAHADLVTLDEVPLLERITAALPRLLGRPFRYPEDLATLSLQERARLVEVWVRTADRVRPGPGRIVDKLPLNMAWLPLVQVLFPDAPVVFAVRDPRDCVLSGVFQDLVPNPAMIHLGRLTDAARLYDSVMRCWVAVRGLPGLRIREQHYEDLVTEPERITRDLCAFIGHDFDPAMLRFHEKAALKPISTPSIGAVSQPLNTRAQGRWKRHAARMAAVDAQLGPWVTYWGYDDDALAAVG